MKRRTTTGSKGWRWRALCVAVTITTLAVTALQLRADETDERAAGLLYERAAELFEQEQLKQAKARVEMALELSARAPYQLLLARVLLASGDCGKALPLLEALAVKDFPRRDRLQAEIHILEGKIACGGVATKLGSTDGMVRLAGGSFTMGSDRGEPDERPPHPVTLKPFWLDRTEVSVAQFTRCVDAGACDPAHFKTARDMRYCNFGDPTRNDHPMNCVDFRAASAFCGWVGRRLPTEAEWELAARGTAGRTFPWGEERPTCARAVMKNSANDGCGQDHTFVVGSKPAGATPEGVLDLSGNVWEWVSDWYAADYYARSEKRDPTGPPDGSVRSMRGGSWLSGDATGLRGANRDNDKIDYVGNGVGLRCARDDG